MSGSGGKEAEVSKEAGSQFVGTNEQEKRGLEGSG